MSAGRAADVLARFAGDGRRLGSRTFFSIPTARRIVAAATEGQLALQRLHVVGEPGTRESLGRVVELVGGGDALGWQGVVFRANAAATAELDGLSARTPAALVAVELLDQAGHFISRQHLPIGQRTDEELGWQLATLEASYAAAAAQGAAVPADAHAELDALRAELRRRRSVR